MTISRFSKRIFCLIGFSSVASCAYMSQTGPQKGDFAEGTANYELVEISSRADLPSIGRTYGQSDVPPPVKGGGYSDKLRPRDTLRFIITDSNELSSFYNSRGEPFSYGPVEVPEDGRVSVPYIGEITVNGRSLAAVSEELNERVKPISNEAQVSVGRFGRIARTANVIGEVRNPGPVPLERSGITSLDLLAASGGPTDPEHLFTYTLRRGGRDYRFDYQGFRKASFPVEEGDLLSVTSDISNRFYVMGAINKPTVVPFPVPAPTLADAIGASSGFDERRSDPSGVFVFRKGNPDRIYTLNLKQPGAMFLAQRFPIKGEDLVYVTEAPLARWNRLIVQLLPVSQFSQAAYNLDRISTN